MRKFSLKIIGLAVLLTGTIFFMLAQVSSEERPYGMYSNMEISEETGDVSGFEFFILPSNEGEFVVFQNAEGWPKKPIVLGTKHLTPKKFIAAAKKYYGLKKDLDKVFKVVRKKK